MKAGIILAIFTSEAPFSAKGFAAHGWIVPEEDTEKCPGIPSGDSCIFSVLPREFNNSGRFQQ